MLPIGIAVAVAVLLLLLLLSIYSRADMALIHVFVSTIRFCVSVTGYIVVAFSSFYSYAAHVCNRAYWALNRVGEQFNKISLEHISLWISSLKCLALEKIQRKLRHLKEKSIY